MVKCKNCGMQTSNKVFCSRQCNLKWISLNRNQFGQKNPSYSTGDNIRVKDICSYCGKETTKLKKSRNAFCDRTCQSLWQKDNLHGENNPNFGKRHIHLNHNRKHSIKTRRKLRESQLKNISVQIFNGLSVMPCVGKHEITILDNLENVLDYKILRQYPIAGYFLDGYCPALNLAIEIDEKHHRRKERLYKDMLRENEIASILKCKFIRIEV